MLGLSARYTACFVTLCCLLFVIIHLNVVQAASQPGLLSAEEEAWLKQHPEIVLGIDAEWAPYVMRNADGTVVGIEVDFIERINALTGTNIQLSLGQWANKVEEAKSHQIDGLASSAYHKTREPFFLFSDTLYTNAKFIFEHKSDASKLTKVNDLAGKRIAIQKGNVVEEKLLLALPSVIPVITTTADEMIALLAKGKVDGAIGDLSVRRLALEKSVPNIDIAFTLPNSEFDIVYSIRKDWPELHSIINKALAKIPQHERLEILAKWWKTTAMNGPQPGLLTAAEKDWLKDHPVLRVVVDPDYLPFEALDPAGNYYGIGSNYTDLIAERLGVEIKIISTKTWSESLALVKDRQADVLPILSTSPRRSEYLNFAVPHIESPTMILTRDDYPKIKGLQDFKGKQVALIKNFNSFSSTQDKYPEIIVVPVETEEQAIWAVAKGQADAAVVDAVVANYFMQYHNLNYLKLAGNAESLGADQMGYGVRKDWPELIPILNKALASITPEESLTIRRKWGDISKPKGASLILEFNAEEQQWLEEHPVIRLGVDPDFAPFEWIDGHGDYIGLAADYMDLISKWLGIHFQVEPDLSWDEVVIKGRGKNWICIRC